MPLTRVFAALELRLTNFYRRHLMEDLKPYTCVFTSCDSKSTPFANISDWTEHLDLAHDFADSWRHMACPICRREAGGSKAATASHLALHLEEVSLMILPTNAKRDESQDPNIPGGSVYNKINGASRSTALRFKCPEESCKYHITGLQSALAIYLHIKKKHSGNLIKDTRTAERFPSRMMPNPNTRSLERNVPAWNLLRTLSEYRRQGNLGPEQQQRGPAPAILSGGATAPLGDTYAHRDGEPVTRAHAPTSSATQSQEPPEAPQVSLVYIP